MVGAGGAGAAVDISFGSLEAAEINSFVTGSNRDSVVVGIWNLRLFPHHRPHASDLGDHNHALQ